MSLDRLLETVRAWEAVVELAPTEGSDAPPIAWGDHFFYVDLDGRVPEREQPFATVVTKDYPGDTACDLDPPGRWRLNIHAGRARFTDLTGEDPRADPAPRDFAEADVVLPHPVYRTQGWLCVVNPAERTWPTALGLLESAHADALHRARARWSAPDPEAPGR